MLIDQTAAAPLDVAAILTGPAPEAFGLGDPNLSTREPNSCR
jgi:hypothetical protein